MFFLAFCESKMLGAYHCPRQAREAVVEEVSREYHQVDLVAKERTFFDSLLEMLFRYF